MKVFLVIFALIYLPYASMSDCRGFKCLNGDCIEKSKVCNGKVDCLDQSDEGRCLNRRYVPPDMSNVITKNGCPISAFQCSSDRQCIPGAWKCDGEPDCNDGSDELACGGSTKRPCGANQFHCASGHCVPQSWRCDGENDCNDNSDEDNCQDIPTTTPTTTMTTSTEAPCSSSEFYCQNKRCISLELKCNGNNDCHDNSDEATCVYSDSVDTNSSVSNEKCGIAGSGSHMYYGEDAMAGQYPWMVKLRMRFLSSAAECGGVLLNSQWIVTAGHCLRDSSNLKAIRVTAYLGRTNFNLSQGHENGMSVESGRIIPHEGYTRGQLRNDIGLVKLRKPIPFQSNIQPICLPGDFCDTTIDYLSPLVDTCSEVEVAGWGRTETGLRSAILKRATMPVRSRMDCNNGLGAIMPLTQMCIGNGSPTACKGDSGGPAMCFRNNRFYVIGLVSYGGLCGNGSPEAFTRVCAYSWWINSTISIN